ncbi:hypothetical protein [Streptococcus uberis]|uniref:hypothetical protein n=1 Tax=Streptococcus uberis TaxID=1349 RepID=UPI001FF167E1|nr:hypothetical protein [Streptococcus uberis]MCK1188135.1 hypothetical protein [Streptococcus uberis]
MENNNLIIDDELVKFQKNFGKSIESSPSKKIFQMENNDFSIFNLNSNNDLNYQRFHQELTVNLYQYSFNVLMKLFDSLEINILADRRKINLTQNIFIYEKENSILFFMEDKGKNRIGVKFTQVNLTEKINVDFLEENNISKLYILRFISIDESLLQREIIDPNNTGKIEFIWFEKFLETYFGKNVTDYFINNTKAQVQKLIKYYGFEVLPHLSNNYLPTLKLQTLEFLKTFKISGSLESQIEENDWQILKSRFFEQGLVTSLLGSKDFAISFMTSEYLFEMINEGNLIDYTPIITGYIKTIEQLLETYLINYLDYSFTLNLKIKKKRSYSKILVTKENQYQFDTTLGSLINFLYDNKDGWYISEYTRKVIYNELLNFNKEDRNQYFHKTNLYNQTYVQELREKTISLLFLLLGGYKLSNDYKEDLKLLKAVNFSYNKLYYQIDKIFSKTYRIKLKDTSTYYYVRKLNYYDVINYNRAGIIQNPIHFRLTENHVWDRKILDTDIIINSDNMPIEIAYSGYDEETWINIDL